MRYSEFHQPSKARQDSGYTKLTSSSAELSSFMAQDKFVELLWENGQVLVHDQSGRNRRNIAVSTNFSDSDRVLRLHVDKATEKDNKDVGVPKTGRPEAMDSFLNEFCLADASYNAESNAKDGDNDMVPWMNYLMGDSIHREYYSGFLCDVPAASLHALSAHGTSVPIHTGSVVGECFSVEHENTYKICADASDPLRTKISHLNELPHQGQASVPAGIKPRAEDLHTGNDSNSQKGPTGSFEGTKLQKQDPPSPKPFQPSSVGLMNFSHFSRPAALAISNLKNVGKLRNNENTTIATCSQAPEPVVVQYSTRANLHSQSERQLNPVLTRLDHESSGKDSKDVTCYEHSKGNFQEHKTSNVTRRNSDTENCISIDHNSDRGSNFTPGLSLARSEIKKGREAIVMPASFCSRMSTGAVSNELQQRDKRKVQEAEESGSHSDDFEDELIGQTKSAAASKGPSIKRSRAAEVHNLSERRRRDRINEKMRALQELIPNCSKVDKASMLDEAIEYLKTLQLQVQMMSMGSGLFVPPLMLPGGMQQMGFGPMAHFSQIGLGMGMGMRLGYGMGMLDMNGSPNYSSLPLPPMHSPQFNCSAPCVPGVTGLHGVPASMAPVFRNPGDLPVSATPAPAAKPTTNPPPSVNSSGAKTNMVHAPDAMPSSSSADQKGQSAKREAVML